MSVTNGQRANQTTFNNAFLSRTAATSSTAAIVTLANVVSASGPSVVNVQREINSLDSFTGRTAGSAYNAKPSWTVVDDFDSTDSLVDRLDDVSQLFDKDSGHSHDGTNRGGAPIEGEDIASTDASFGDELVSDGAGGASWLPAPHGFNFTTVRTSIADNQGSPANVTGMDISAFQAVIFYLQLTRKTNSTEKTVVGTLTCIKRQNSSAYVIIPDLKGDGDSDGGDAYDGAGVTFSITSAGQVQYISDDMPGSSYSGIITYRGMTFNPPTPDLF